MNKQKSDEITAKEFIIKISEWYNYFLSQWKIILLVGLLGSALGLTYAFTQKPVYTASLSFAVEDQQQSGGFSGALGLASQFGIDLGQSGGSVFSGANLIQLFKSRAMVEKTLLAPVKKEGNSISFAEMYIQDLEWRNKWKENPKLKNLQFLPKSERKMFTRAQDSVLGVIYQSLISNSLTVEVKDKKVDIITIEVKYQNEYFAKTFSEALAEEVSGFYILTKTQKARTNLQILERQTDSIRGELNNAITGVAVANDNIFSLNPALNVRRVPSARKQVDVQANTVILTELVKQFELAKVALRKETPLIQIIDRPILPLEKVKFGKLKGLIVGGLLAGIILCLILFIRRVYKQIMQA